MAIAEVSISGGPAAGHATAGWPRIIVWTVLFQIAWFWRRIPDIVAQGALPGNDDFQRLSQIRAWLGGQPWYDVVNYRMNPPAGAEMHWSRLVDVPLAALISFFDLFMDTVMAERIAAIVWPMLLLIMTVAVIIEICRRLDPAVNPLLVLLFTVTCFAALAEFRPGRIDHHSLQILFFALIMLTLVDTRRFWAPFLCGGVMIASISVGLDAILLILFVLGWIGMSWMLGRDSSDSFMRRTGAAILLALPVFMAFNLPPSKWLVAQCDALSAVYAAGFGMVGLAFVLLPSLPETANPSPYRSFILRFGAGLFCAAIAGAVLFQLFPQCAGGPYGAISPELREQWLVNVEEARGLLGQLEETPQIWIAVLGYGLFLLGISAFMAFREQREKPEYLALFAVLAISFLASFLQYRALRIGIFASIPFLVAFALLSWDSLRERYKEARPLAMAAQGVVVLLLLSPTWLGLASLVFPGEESAAVTAAENAAGGSSAANQGWRNDSTMGSCNREDEYAVLASLPPGHVMTDINSGAPALVFTPHTVVGGPYHRNADAILASMDFFLGKPESARVMARERGLDYVAYCEPAEPMSDAARSSRALAARILEGDEPQWLDRVSPPGERMQVFRIVTP